MTLNTLIYNDLVESLKVMGHKAALRCRPSSGGEGGATAGSILVLTLINATSRNLGTCAGAAVMC